MGVVKKKTHPKHVLILNIGDNFKIKANKNIQSVLF